MFCGLRFFLAGVFTILATVSNVIAWGAAGHEIVATIAQIYLHPTVFPQLCELLNYTSPDPTQPPCHLAPVASWADRMRFRMRWSAPLHYIGALSDHPPDSCLFPGPRGWAGRKGGNVLGAVRNTTDILRDWVSHSNSNDVNHLYDFETANEALKFLIHFLGDMHMPLHLTGRDRGGNSVKVSFGGRITNLHSLWDNLLIAKALRTVPQNYTRPLPLPQVERSLRGAIYDPFVRRIMHQGILDMWRDDIPQWLSCPARLRAPGGSYIRQHVVSVLSESTVGFDVSDETDDEVVCPYQWAKPIHALNCDLVWPAELDAPPYDHRHDSQADEDFYCSEEDDVQDEDELHSASGPYLELDTPEYAGLIADEWVIEKLLAMAGLRLAGVLNHLFADDGLR